MGRRIRKVLVVEDNEDIQVLLACRLELMGFTVIQAKNGKDAVKKASKIKPQLILMDIMMPEMDGREATRIIRSDPRTRHIPIIALTALTGASHQASCIEAGCNDYIAKPFTARQLQEKVGKFTVTSSPTILNNVQSPA